MSSKWTLPVLLLCFLSSWAQTVKRGRNEGTFNIPASNVIGNGNITVAASLLGGYSKGHKESELKVDPGIYLCIGVGDILQLSTNVNFTNFQGLGTSQAHLQITTPGNNNLRFFGVGLSGDMYLSTVVDTVSGEAASGRPEYNSYLRSSIILDLDWIALNRSFPLKTYLSFSMVDNPDILFLYEQLSFKSGFEWKMYQNSLILDIGYGLYKENKNVEFNGDKSFLQQTLWIEPGIRYRLLGRLSVIGSLRMLIFQKVKADRPLPANYIRASGTVELPILFRETNTEAIRTLGFVDQEKEKRKDIVSKNIEQQKSLKPDFEVTFEGIKSDMPDIDQEKESLQKREEIQQKMDEIESLLEELE